MTLTSSAPRKTCQCCWSPSPTSSWHKSAHQNKNICTHAARHVVICSHMWIMLVGWCHDVPSLSDDSPPLIDDEINCTLHFTDDLRVIGTHVTSILHPHTYTCPIHKVYPICQLATWAPIKYLTNGCFHWISWLGLAVLVCIDNGSIKAEQLESLSSLLMQMFLLLRRFDMIHEKLV